MKRNDTIYLSLNDPSTLATARMVAARRHLPPLIAQALLDHNATPPQLICYIRRSLPYHFLMELYISQTPSLLLERPISTASEHYDMLLPITGATTLTVTEHTTHCFTMFDLLVLRYQIHSCAFQTDQNAQSTYNILAYDSPVVHILGQQESAPQTPPLQHISRPLQATTADDHMLVQTFPVDHAPHTLTSNISYFYVNWTRSAPNIIMSRTTNDHATLITPLDTHTSASLCTLLISLRTTQRRFCPNPQLEQLNAHPRVHNLHKLHSSPKVSHLKLKGGAPPIATELGLDELKLRHYMNENSIDQDTCVYSYDLNKYCVIISNEDHDAYTVKLLTAEGSILHNTGILVQPRSYLYSTDDLITLRPTGWNTINQGLNTLTAAYEMQDHHMPAVPSPQREDTMKPSAFPLKLRDSALTTIAEAIDKGDTLPPDAPNMVSAALQQAIIMKLQEENRTTPDPATLSQLKMDEMQLTLLSARLQGHLSDQMARALQRSPPGTPAAPGTGAGGPYVPWTSDATDRFDFAKFGRTLASATGRALSSHESSADKRASKLTEQNLTSSEVAKLRITLDLTTTSKEIKKFKRYIKIKHAAISETLACTPATIHLKDDMYQDCNTYIAKALWEVLDENEPRVKLFLDRIVPTWSSDKHMSGIHVLAAIDTYNVPRTYADIQLVNAHFRNTNYFEKCLSGKQDCVTVERLECLEDWRRMPGRQQLPGSEHRALLTKLRPLFDLTNPQTKQWFFSQTERINEAEHIALTKGKTKLDDFPLDLMDVKISELFRLSQTKPTQKTFAPKTHQFKTPSAYPVEMEFDAGDFTFDVDNEFASAPPAQNPQMIEALAVEFNSECCHLTDEQEIECMQVRLKRGSICWDCGKETPAAHAPNRFSCTTCDACDISFCPGNRGESCVVKTSEPFPAHILNANKQPISTRMTAILQRAHARYNERRKARPSAHAARLASTSTMTAPRE